MIRISTSGKSSQQVHDEFVAAIDRAYEAKFGPQTAIDVRGGETAIVDAKAERTPERHEQDRLFAPVDVMAGQLGLEV